MIKKSVIKEVGKDIYVQALEIFLRSAEKDFKLLNLYIEVKDYSNAKLLSHKLIGSCQAIGVKKLPLLLKELDNNLKKNYVMKNDISYINQSYNELKDYLQSTFSLEIEW